MSQVDYPDWMRVDQEVGDPFVSDNAVFRAPAVPVSYGPFFTGPWESLTVTAHAPLIPGEYVRVDVTWSTSSALTDVIGVQTAWCRSDAAIAEQFAVLGPWCGIAVTWGATGGAVATVLQVLPRRAMHGWSRNITSAALLRFVGLSVGAGATVRTIIPVVTSGRAHLHVDTTAALWVATVETRDTADTIDGSVAQAFQTAAFLQPDVDFLLPSTQAVVALQNSDGAARVFRGSVVVDTSW